MKLANILSLVLTPTITTMSYTYVGLSYRESTKNWFVHLHVPTTLEFHDPYNFILQNDRRFVQQNVVLLIPGAKNQKSTKSPPDYKVVTQQHQIDESGKIIVCTAWNIRQSVLAPGGTRPRGPARLPTEIPLEGKRYATQFDFDKYCFENPDARFPFDWNAEVYKAYISPVRTTIKSTTWTCPKCQSGERIQIEDLCKNCAAAYDDSDDEEYQYSTNVQTGWDNQAVEASAAAAEAVDKAELAALNKLM